MVFIDFLIDYILSFLMSLLDSIINNNCIIGYLLIITLYF